ncbi:MAG: glycoside hydrolase family 88 protein [Rikenellaceae bacterium]|nr:glycoside hydrolase family 88 protein [Rikenellaceae bacterium]
MEKPAAAEVLAAMEQANGYFMKKWPDTSEGMPYPSRNRVYPSNIWTRAVYYEGLLALYGIDPKPEYLQYAVDWGESHGWNLNRGAATRNADNQCCGQIYLELYQMDPRPERLDTIKASVDAMMAGRKIDDWWWIDALQMAMPVFGRLSLITGDNAYLERAYRMYLYTKNQHGENGLYNPEDRLWWRDKDFVPPYTEPNGKDCYWSRGNGWVVAAMVRMLEITPVELSEHRQEYMRMLVDMCQAVLPLQREDGLWNVSLHDPDHYGGKELTGTALFVYGMAYGVNTGMLDAAVFAPVVYKAWNAMVNDCLHENGFLGYVQGTGKEPKDGQPVLYDSVPDFEDYGLGCFLLAGTEVYKMVNS